jgi:hypothetical protein
MSATDDRRASCRSRASAVRSLGSGQCCVPAALHLSGGLERGQERERMRQRQPDQAAHALWCHCAGRGRRSGPRHRAEPRYMASISKLLAVAGLSVESVFYRCRGTWLSSQLAARPRPGGGSRQLCPAMPRRRFVRVVLNRLRPTLGRVRNQGGRARLIPVPPKWTGESFVDWSTAARP